jgi:short-subunit dehydrogenase
MEKAALFRMRPMEAATVARLGYRAMMSGKVLAIAGFRNWLLAELVRFSPRKVVTAISGKLLENAH